MAGHSGDAAAGVRGRGALVQPLDRSAVVGVADRWTHVEQLVDGELTVEDVPADQAEVALHLVRSDDLLVQDGVLEARGH